MITSKLFIKNLPLILLILSSCGQTNSNTSKTTNVSKIEIKATFDVPTLIGKNIDEVRKILGNPSDNEIEPSRQQMKMNLDTWDNSFEIDGQTLLVSFNPQNRKVFDFFIETNDPSGSTSDYSDLLKVCNVDENNSNYIIEAVPTIKDNSKFTGIKIKLK